MKKLKLLSLLLLSLSLINTSPVIAGDEQGEKEKKEKTGKDDKKDKKKTEEIEIVGDPDRIGRPCSEIADKIARSLFLSQQSYHPWNR